MDEVACVEVTRLVVARSSLERHKVAEHCVDDGRVERQAFDEAPDLNSRSEQHADGRNRMREVFEEVVVKIKRVCASLIARGAS